MLENIFSHRSPLSKHSNKAEISEFLQGGLGLFDYDSFLTKTVKFFTKDAKSVSKRSSISQIRCANPNGEGANPLFSQTFSSPMSSFSQMFHSFLILLILNLKLKKKEALVS